MHPRLLHPTTSGERAAGIIERFSHIAELHRRGSLSMATADAGCFALALGLGDEPLSLPVFGNSAEEVAWIFRWCREVDMPVHVSIFEPGSLRLALAHLEAGSLPRRTKIQLYFGGQSALFGLPPTRPSLDAYVAMLAGTDLPWMVGVFRGDVIDTGLAEAALRAGGHVRVGLEDYFGPDQPTNEDLVSRVVHLAEQLDRRPAGPAMSTRFCGGCEAGEAPRECRFQSLAVRFRPSSRPRQQACPLPARRELPRGRSRMKTDSDYRAQSADRPDTAGVAHPPFGNCRYRQRAARLQCREPKT